MLSKLAFDGFPLILSGNRCKLREYSKKPLKFQGIFLFRECLILSCLRYGLRGENRWCLRKNSHLAYILNFVSGKT